MDRESLSEIDSLLKLGDDGFSLVLFGAEASDSKAFCKNSYRVSFTLLVSQDIERVGRGCFVGRVER